MSRACGGEKLRGPAGLLFSRARGRGTRKLLHGLRQRPAHAARLAALPLASWSLSLSPICCLPPLFLVRSTAAVARRSSSPKSPCPHSLSLSLISFARSSSLSNPPRRSLARPAASFPQSSSPLSIPSIASAHAVAKRPAEAAGTCSTVYLGMPLQASSKFGGRLMRLARLPPPASSSPAQSSAPLCLNSSGVSSSTALSARPPLA